MPAYNSQALAGGNLQSISPGQGTAVVFNAETPASGVASVACAIQAHSVSSGPQLVSVQFECPGGIGSGVFQIQDASEDVAADYCSINFNSATPGQVVTGNMNASGVARVELQVAARFLRILCVTTPGAAITVRIQAH